MIGKNIFQNSCISVDSSFIRIFSGNYFMILHIQSLHCNIKQWHLPVIRFQPVLLIVHMCLFQVQLELQANHGLLCFQKVLNTKKKSLFSTTKLVLHYCFYGFDECKRCKTNLSGQKQERSSKIKAPEVSEQLRLTTSFTIPYQFWSPKFLQKQVSCLPNPTKHKIQPTVLN